MTSSTIPETVESTLRNAGLGSYTSQARPVVDALVAREASICNDLIDFASEQGMGREAVVGALREAGMHVPVPGTLASADAQNQDAAVAPADGDLAATLARINDTLEDLAGFARQNGWRPSR
jgi:hypothetical protein